jgi:hypothetical protein
MKVINPLNEITKYTFKDIKSLFSHDILKTRTIVFFIDKISIVEDGKNTKYPTTWQILKPTVETTTYFYALYNSNLKGTQ